MRKKVMEEHVRYIEEEMKKNGAHCAQIRWELYPMMSHKYNDCVAIWPILLVHVIHIFTSQPASRLCKRAKLAILFWNRSSPAGGSQISIMYISTRPILPRGMKPLTNIFQSIRRLFRKSRIPPIQLFRYLWIICVLYLYSIGEQMRMNNSERKKTKFMAFTCTYDVHDVLHSSIHELACRKLKQPETTLSGVDSYWSLSSA